MGIQSCGHVGVLFIQSSKVQRSRVPGLIRIGTAALISELLQSFRLGEYDQN
jgi:hypothetical protein